MLLEFQYLFRVTNSCNPVNLPSVATVPHPISRRQTIPRNPAGLGLASGFG